MFTFSDLNTVGVSLSWFPSIVAPVGVLLLVEWFSRGRDVPLLPKSRVLRWAAYGLLLGFIMWFKPEAQTFIYFQF